MILLQNNSYKKPSCFTDNFFPVCLKRFVISVPCNAKEALYILKNLIISSDKANRQRNRRYEIYVYIQN